jgi:FkbM family methyltransferase
VFLAIPTLIRYGTLKPHRVKLYNCENWIHIDPNDMRTIKKFVRDPIRKRISPPLLFWRAFIEKLQPNVAIDIGMNYGECIFGTRYPQKTKVYGFEANPHIFSYLKKSLDDHPDSKSIHIVEGLVSDKIEQAVTFYYDPTWSGTGSAIESLNNCKNLITTNIQSRTIDSVIPRLEIEGAILLFKMDIEGYESKAFDGFWNTIGLAKLTLGFIEFDTTYIHEAGANPALYFSKLMDKFDIYRLDEQHVNSVIPVYSFDSLPISRASDKRVHTDLLLITKNSNLSDWLPDNWTNVT